MSSRDQPYEEEEELEQEADDDGFVLRCLRALDVHVIGACRADERLTPLPLLKLNAASAAIPTTGHAQDRLIAQLIQHFEVSEIGLLARCLCLPLVSIRVGKINKQGTLLCPTAARGHLNVNILPSSCLRISYVGDDGQTVPHAVISNDDDDIIIDEISSDTSGRSFSLSLPHSNHFYYWLSEKSLSEGIHLLHKMKDILERKVTLSDVTGISNSRLESFGTHLKAYLLGSSSSSISQSEQSCSSLSPVNNIPRPTTSRNRHSKNPNLRSRSIVSFKDAGASSSSSSSTSKIAFARGDKSKRRNNNNNSSSGLLLNIGSSSSTPLGIPSLPIVSCPLPLPTIPSSSSSSSSSDPFALPADILPHFSPFDPITFKFPHPPPPNNNNNKPKPYYCWCPMGSSSDPLESMSMSMSPLVVPSSPLPIGPGLMSDPIVHIPIMDVRSSGQAYLVSAGPMISTAVVVPTTTTESNARETLRRLLESAPSDLTPHPIHTVITGISEIRFFSSSPSSSSLEGDDEEVSSDQEDDQIQEK